MSQFDRICEVQSDKASVTITSRYDGLVKTLHFNVNDVAIVGTALLDIEVEDDSKDAEKNSEEIKEANKDQTFDGLNKETDETESQDKILGKILATPAVRRIALENNIKLKDVAATGKGSRVLKEDILAHLRKISATPDVQTKVFPGKDMVERTVGLKGYSKHMWKTMTKSLVNKFKILKISISTDFNRLQIK